MKPINRVKIGEERFATQDNKKLMARAKFKRAVIKILTKLQAYHLYEKIKRNKISIIPIHKFVKDYKPIYQEQAPDAKVSFYEDSDEETDKEDDSGSMNEDSYDDNSVDISEEENAEMFDETQPHIGKPLAKKGPSRKTSEKSANPQMLSPTKTQIVKSGVVLSTPDLSDKIKAQKDLTAGVIIKRGLTVKETETVKKPESKPQRQTHAKAKAADNDNDTMFDNVDPDKLDWR